MCNRAEISHVVLTKGLINRVMDKVGQDAAGALRRMIHVFISGNRPNMNANIKQMWRDDCTPCLRGIWSLLSFLSQEFSPPAVKCHFSEAFMWKGNREDVKVVSTCTPFTPPPLPLTPTLSLCASLSLTPLSPLSLTLPSLPSLTLPYLLSLY